MEFVKGDLTTDEGLEKHVRFTKVDFVYVGKVPTVMPMLGGDVGRQELATGRHDFEVKVEALYGSGAPQSMTCAGTFDVPGGPAVLRLKVDVIVRRPPNRDGKVAAECQVGGSSRLVPSPLPSSGPVRSTLRVRILSQGRSVADATVGVSGSGPTQEVVSDATGTATFKGLGQGDHMVSIVAIGYRRFTARVDVDGASIDYVAELQAPVGRTVSDENGRFSVTLASGRYDVHIQLGGSAQHWVEKAAVSASRGVQIHARLQRGSVWATTSSKPRGAKPGGTVFGTVLDQRGAPVAGAVIAVFAERVFPR